MPIAYNDISKTEGTMGRVHFWGEAWWPFSIQSLPISPLESQSLGGGDGGQGGGINSISGNCHLPRKAEGPSRGELEHPFTPHPSRSLPRLLFTGTYETVRNLLQYISLYRWHNFFLKIKVTDPTVPSKEKKPIWIAFSLPGIQRQVFGQTYCRSHKIFWLVCLASFVKEVHLSSVQDVVMDKRARVELGSEEELVTHSLICYKLSARRPFLFHIKVVFFLLILHSGG